MKIAQVAPLLESVPPRLYGGTERVVSYLTEELVQQGHDVTLFASGDSITSAKLKSVVNKAIRLNPSHLDPTAFHILMLEELSRISNEFDIIHYHIDVIHFLMSRNLLTPHITTMHGRLDLPDLKSIFRSFTDIPLVSISDNQRLPLPLVNWQATVYNGVPMENYKFQKHPGNYLAFLGRISPEKGIEQAINIAIASGMHLCIAAKIDANDEEYYNSIIKPHLTHPLIEFIGEINELEKDEFLGNAFAVLFPIQWPEPFGLVMIESMACGTPVIAFKKGSVPEIMIHGETGFIVNTIEQAVEAVEQIETISRECCRYIFEKRFSSKEMANSYLEVYQQTINKTLIQPSIAV
ncbi:MAG: glycosyltransferase family 4 protein [Thiohalomonadales bacterium]